MSIVEKPNIEFDPSAITVDDIVAFADSDGHELPYEEIQFALSDEGLIENKFVIEALAYTSEDKAKKRRVVSLAVELARITPIFESAQARQQLEANYVI